MRLGQLIAKLQATLDKYGDTENVGLGLVVGRTTKYRLDAFGDIDILHDTAQYPTGMAMLVGEVQEGKTFPQLPVDWKTESTKLRAHLSELAKWADKAAMVLATLEVETADEEEQIQQIIDGISKWAPDALMGSNG